MRRSLPLCGALLALGAVTLAFLAGDAPAEPAARRTFAPNEPAQNCKPDAPVRLDLFPRDLVGGTARVDYEVEPVMDALDLRVEVVLPQGGQLRWHNTAAEGALPRQTRRSGSLSVDLPAHLSGVEVEVRALISIPDPDAPDGIGTYTTSRRASWGAVERVITGVTEVITDGELTLDTAATRR